MEKLTVLLYLDPMPTDQGIPTRAEIIPKEFHPSRVPVIKSFVEKKFPSIAERGIDKLCYFTKKDVARDGFPDLIGFINANFYLVVKYSKNGVLDGMVGILPSHHGDPFAEMAEPGSSNPQSGK